MPRVSIPDGDGEERQRMWQLHPTFGTLVDDFSREVELRSILPYREHEAARIRMAHINRCEPCSDARPADMDAWGLDESFYTDVDDPALRGRYTTRERLAIEFAERYVAGVDAFDDAYWDEMHANFSDAEMIDLTVSVGKYMGSGRMNAVLGLTVSCPIRMTFQPAPPARELAGVR